MSQTVRISDEVYDAIEEYREKNQSFQEVIEEMAIEFGLLPDDIKDVEDLKRRLESKYGFEPDHVREIVRALQFVYTGQEKPNSIGVPHDEGDERYGDEIEILRQLDLVKRKHYTGKYDYGYRTTKTGSDLGSELVRTHIDEHTQEISEILENIDDALLGVILRFGFSKTDSGHLSDRGAKLKHNSPGDFWDISKIQLEYLDFKSDLEEIGIAERYDITHGLTVIPPEFNDYIQNQINTDSESIMVEIEICQTIHAYARGNIDDRESILHNLEFASEEQFEATVEELHAEGLTSTYLPDQQAPLLIKSSEVVEDWIQTQIKDLLGVSE